MICRSGDVPTDRNFEVK
jgi:hypothetical protein